MSSLTRVIHDRVTVLIRIDTRNVNASRVFGHNAKSNSMCTRIVFLSIFCKSDINYYCNNNNNNKYKKKKNQNVNELHKIYKMIVKF